MSRRRARLRRFPSGSMLVPTPTPPATRQGSGVAASGVLVSERSGNAREEGALGAAALLDADPGLTAIMCTSDILAFGALDALASRAIEVPARITVTGFDDVPAASSAGLTTVRQPMERKGRAAVEA